jgi:MarR family transcriptional regulator for hemolysin
MSRPAMTHNVDPDSFGFIVNDLSRLLLAEMDRRTGEAGIALTSGERRTLAHAARAGAVRQNVLAERMGLEAMTLSAYLDRLEAAGLVERRPDPTDRRAKIVHLTRTADDVLKAIMPISAALHADASRQIPEKDWNRLLEQLKLVRDTLNAMRADATRGEKTAA